MAICMNYRQLAQNFFRLGAMGAIRIASETTTQAIRRHAPGDHRFFGMIQQDLLTQSVQQHTARELRHTAQALRHTARALRHTARALRHTVQALRHTGGHTARVQHTTLSLALPLVLRTTALGMHRLASMRAYPTMVRSPLLALRRRLGLRLRQRELLFSSWLSSSCQRKQPRRLQHRGTRGRPPRTTARLAKTTQTSLTLPNHRHQQNRRGRWPNFGLSVRR